MDAVQEILSHHGVKGMKWGVRKGLNGRSGPTEVVLRAKGGTKIKTSGGKGHPPSEDAVRTAVSRQRAKKSSVSSLSNKELQDLVQRLNMERQYKSLTSKNPAKDFVTKLLVDAGQREASKAVNDQVEKALKKK